MPAITWGAIERACQIQLSPLLSLPWELRDIIWKLVIGPEPYLLHPTTCKWEKVQMNITTQCTAMSTSYLNASCMTLHREPGHTYQIPTPQPTVANPTPPNRSGALSWLRTCRLIYSEAKRLLVNNISLHICNRLSYQGALEHRSSYPPLSQIRFLTLCVPIKVMSDLHDGFWYVYDAGRGSEISAIKYRLREYRRYYREDQRWARWNWELFTTFDHRKFRSSRKKLTHLEELRLHVFFECQLFQGNPRPMLNRLENPVAGLKWMGDTNEASIKGLVFRLCYETALDMFNQEGVPALVVNFDMKGIRHYPWNIRPDACDQCWCRGRWIDQETVPLKNIEKFLRECLLKKGDDEGSYGIEGREEQ